MVVKGGGPRPAPDDIIALSLGRPMEDIVTLSKEGDGHDR